MADIPLLISSENASSERRITPSWSLAHLKARLEPITGIPAHCQRLRLHIASQPPQALEADDEEATPLSRWNLQAYAEIVVTDTRPPHLRANFTDPSTVEKYTLPLPAYESRADTVLAWKKSHHLGRFDPDAPAHLAEKVTASFQEIETRGIEVGKRCRLLPSSDDRRGTVRFVGEVDALPGVGAWVGVELDEPTGRNDGSVAGKEGGTVRLFSCGRNHGVLVRGERVEVGEFPVRDEFADEEEEDREF